MIVYQHAHMSAARKLTS